MRRLALVLVLLACGACSMLSAPQAQPEPCKARAIPMYDRGGRLVLVDTQWVKTFYCQIPATH